MGIECDLLAFMVDEFSIYLETELTDDKGITRWNTLHTKSKYVPSEKVSVDPNVELMNHIKKHDKGPNVTVK